MAPYAYFNAHFCSLPLVYRHLPPWSCPTDRTPWARAYAGVTDATRSNLHPSEELKVAPPGFVQEGLRKQRTALQASAATLVALGAGVERCVGPSSAS